MSEQEPDVSDFMNFMARKEAQPKADPWDVRDVVNHEHRDRQSQELLRSGQLDNPPEPTKHWWEQDAEHQQAEEAAAVALPDDLTPAEEAEVDRIMDSGRPIDYVTARSQVLARRPRPPVDFSQESASSAMRVMHPYRGGGRGRTQRSDREVGPFALGLTGDYQRSEEQQAEISKQAEEAYLDSIERKIKEGELTPLEAAALMRKRHDERHAS